LIKTHPRQPPGTRVTDPADYPAERTTYALRSPDRVVREAEHLGAFVGLFAERLLGGTYPWSKLRQGQKLLRLAKPYTAARLDAACERALAVDLIDVRRLERILTLALEQVPLPADPPPARRAELPSARFAREGAAFDHRHPDHHPDHPAGEANATTPARPTPALPGSVHERAPAMGAPTRNRHTAPSSDPEATA
jgi:hypothetical protein